MRVLYHAFNVYFLVLVGYCMGRFDFRKLVYLSPIVHNHSSTTSHAFGCMLRMHAYAMIDVFYNYR